MKGFRNIGTLDLRKASPEALADIEFIENIGTLLLGEGQEAYTSHIRQENIGSVYALNKDIKVISHNGTYSLSYEVLEGMHEKVFLMVNGVLRVEDLKDIDLKDKFFKLVINGQVIAKEKDYGILCSYAEINGDSVTYKNHETYIEGTFSLEDDELYGIKPDSHLVVDGLRVLKDFNFEIFYKHIKNIRVGQQIIISKHLIPHVAQKIENYSRVKKIVVEEGYEYYSKLTLNEDDINTLKSKKIHVGGTLKIEMPAEDLEGYLEKIVCHTLEAYKEDLEKIKPLLASVDKIKAIDLEVKKNLTKLYLSAESLEAFKPLKLENLGKLVVSEDLLPEAIDNDIEWIENLGVITCTKDQYGWLMKKVKLNHGVIKKTSFLKKDSNQKENIISNLGTYEF